MAQQAINFNILQEFPIMLVISGPSGVGKDTVLRALKKSILPIHHVITANTRTPRKDEREGVDYFFVTRQYFEEMIKNNELVEYSRVYDDYKGVPKAQIREALASGKDVVLRLDVQGANKIKKIYPQAILIFLAPSSKEEWLKRLGSRHVSEEKDIETRIATIKMEMEHARKFDYIVINAQNKLDETIKIIESIIIAEHHKPSQKKIEI